MKKLMMVLAALMLTVNTFSQTQEIIENRKDMVKELNGVFDEMNELFDGSAYFDNDEDAMCILIIGKLEVDMSAKEMWVSIHHEWSRPMQMLLIEQLDIHYLKVIFIGKSGNKTSYKNRIILQ